MLWTVKLDVIKEFCPNLEQMFKHTATDLKTQLTMTKQRLTCTLKNGRLLPDGCCYLNNMGNKVASESTGDVEIRAVLWPHRKKSIGMRSGDLGGQAICLPCPIQ